MASKSADAVKAEAEKPETIEVEFRGDKYTLPGNAEEWDVEVMEFLEKEKLVSCLEALLGADQWTFLKRRHRPKMKELDEIADTFLSAVGLSSGKSEG